MIIVHIEVMTLQWMAIHASVNRVEVHIAGGILRVEIYNHFEISNVFRIEHDIVAVVEQFAARDVWCVIVAAKWYLTVEEEFKRGLRPR